MNFKKGDIIDDHFQVECRLGIGASGETYRVTLIKDWSIFHAGHRFALKYYLDAIFELEQKDISIARRLRELSIGIQASHPNLVTTIDSTSIQKDSHPRYLLMKLIDGVVLDDFIKTNGHGILLVTTLGFSLASAIQKLHSAGIIHRDIKAQNIVIRSDSTPVLLDFGVVRSFSDSSVTHSQGFLGTYRYGAPEYLFDGKSGFSSDVYAFGVLLFHTLTGQELFYEAQSVPRIIAAAKNEEPTFPEFTDGPSYFTAKLIKKMLHKNEKMRPSVSEILDFFQYEHNSTLWSTFRIEELKLQLPEKFRFPESLRQIRQLISQNFDLTQLDSALCLKNATYLDRIAKDAGIDVTYSKEVFFSRSATDRINLIRLLFERFDEYGGGIEQAFNLASEIIQYEKDPNVLEIITPIFQMAQKNWDEMWQSLAQENP